MKIVIRGTDDSSVHCRKSPCLIINIIDGQVHTFMLSVFYHIWQFGVFHCVTLAPKSPDHKPFEQLCSVSSRKIANCKFTTYKSFRSGNGIRRCSAKSWSILMNSKYQRVECYLSMEYSNPPCWKVLSQTCLLFHLKYQHFLRHGVIYINRVWKRISTIAFNRWLYLNFLYLGFILGQFFFYERCSPQDVDNYDSPQLPIPSRT